MSTGGVAKRRNHRNRRPGNNNRSKPESTAALAEKDEMSASVLSDGASVTESQLSASVATDDPRPISKAAAAPVDMDTSDVVSNISDSPVFANIGEPQILTKQQNKQSSNIGSPVNDKNQKVAAIVNGTLSVSPAARAEEIAPVMKIDAGNSAPFVSSGSSGTSSSATTPASVVVSPASVKVAAASALGVNSPNPKQQQQQQPPSNKKERRVKTFAKRIYKIFEVPLNYMCENVTQRVIMPNLRLVDMLIQDLPAKFRVTAVWWIELLFVACGFMFLGFWFFVTKIGLYLFQTGVMLALMPIRLTKTCLIIVYRIITGLLMGVVKDTQ